MSSKSIFNLGDFIEGFSLGVSKEDYTPIMKDFRSYVVAKNPQLEHLDTFYIFYEIADQDEVKAFDLFFAEFENFLIESGMEIPRYDIED